MINPWTIKISIPLIGAALAVACTGNNPQDRGAVAETGPKSADARPITLAGCVGTGSGTQQYVLTQVRIAPLAEQPSDAPSSTGQSITEHSQVRLAMADGEELRKFVGQTVELNGTVTDSGRNTIGTTGQERSPNEPEPRTDASQAATPQHHSEKAREEMGPIGNRAMNNGTVPEVTVQRISGTGQKCTPTPARPEGDGGRD
jgi:hypothetical protein